MTNAQLPPQALAKQTGWTGGQFSIIRAILGVYLTVHFLSLMPWGTEVFSNQGALPIAQHSPLLRAFPNILAIWDSPTIVMVILGVGASLGVMFALGIKQRVTAICLWYIWAILLGRNPLILNPGIPYVGWMLLLVAALPSSPYLSMDARHRVDPAGSWWMPRSYLTVAWIVMVVGYSYSGIMKLGSPSWIDGTAIEHVLNSPLARSTVIREWLGQQTTLLHMLTWSTLALEIGAAPLALWSRARPYLWFALVGLHIGIIATVNFTDLTVGMLMIHLITFDPRWLPKLTVPYDTTDHIVFDGQCGLCHGFVRFVLAEDIDECFVFAAGPETLTQVEVHLNSSATVLVGPAAVAHVLKRLGGLWGPIGWLIDALPDRLTASMYQIIATYRRLIPVKTQTCPIPPARFRGRWRLLNN